MRHLFAVSCLVLGTPLSASAAEPKGAIPRGSPGDWVTTADYPAEALIDGVQGTVSFRLAIGVDGSVSACETTVSSGSELLDTTACNLITLRARFTPATDARGRPIKGTYANRVRWVVPQAVPQPRPFDTEYTFIVDENGQIKDCEIVRTKGLTPAELAEAKEGCNQGLTTTSPFLDESGTPAARLVRTRTTVTIEPAPQP